jgi:dihydroxy-acid dehydratase
LSDAELQQRLAALPPFSPRVQGGALEKYAKLVGPAHLGAVTHSGTA